VPLEYLPIKEQTITRDRIRHTTLRALHSRDRDGMVSWRRPVGGGWPLAPLAAARGTSRLPAARFSHGFSQ